MWQTSYMLLGPECRYVIMCNDTKEMLNFMPGKWMREMFIQSMTKMHMYQTFSCISSPSSVEVWQKMLGYNDKMFFLEDVNTQWRIALGLKTRVQSQIIQQINFRIFDPNLLFKMGLNSGDQNIWKNQNCFNNVIFSRLAWHNDLLTLFIFVLAPTLALWTINFFSPSCMPFSPVIAWKRNNQLEKWMKWINNWANRVTVTGKQQKSH